MLRVGMSVRVVAKILGHEDPALTLRRYSHVLPDMQEGRQKRWICIAFRRFWSSLAYNWRQRKTENP